MKRFVSLFVLAIFAISVFAQKDVTTFLGIPVDGSKSEMKKKLIAKGFTPKQEYDVDFLEGEFNGMDVRLFIITNNNKVYRIMLTDAINQNESDIITRFNHLVRQFYDNERYISLYNNIEEAIIPDNEDIAYGTIKNKVYEANFFQKPNIEGIDSTAIRQMMMEELSSEYSIKDLKENKDEDEYNKLAMSIMIKAIMKYAMKKSVWFRINRFAGEYYITMYYDNEYNQANGEDL